MNSYVYAVQDEGGREICSWSGEVERVSDVWAVLESDNKVVIRTTAHKLATPDPVAVPYGTLFLHRWPADQKANDDARVTHRIKRPSEES